MFDNIPEIIYTDHTNIIVSPSGEMYKYLSADGSIIGMYKVFGNIEFGDIVLVQI